MRTEKEMETAEYFIVNSVTANTLATKNYVFREKERYSYIMNIPVIKQSGL